MDKELLKRLLSYGEEREIAVGLTIDDKDYFVNPAEVERIDKIRWGESMRNFQDPWKMLELPVRTLAYIGEADPVSDMEAHFPELKFPLFSSRLGADIIEVQASKANGLVRLCEYYGMDISQTVAFGDSMNDYEIVQAAGTGIAMGNSVQKLKDTADYVTDDIARDGVWKACRHFGWI
jgi:hydroxymethylpyrimidine pyrophosphatase-like HAD family hydrolase